MADDLHAQLGSSHDDDSSGYGSRPAAPRGQTYKVSNPAALLPSHGLGRKLSLSPSIDSLANDDDDIISIQDERKFTAMPPRLYRRPVSDGRLSGPVGGLVQNRRAQFEQLESERPYYDSSPLQSQSPSPPRPARRPAYESQILLEGRQEDVPAPLNIHPAVPVHSSSPSIPPPIPSHSSPFQDAPRVPYHDRSPSRTRLPALGVVAPYVSNDPFATPRASVATLPPYSQLRPSPDRLASRTSFRAGDAFGGIDPVEIEDDDPDPFSEIRPSSKKSRPGWRISSGKSAAAGAAGAGFAAPAIAAGGSGLGFLTGTRDGSGAYGSVPGGDLQGSDEKSAWLSKQTADNKRLKWTVAGLIVLVIVLAIIGGVVGVLVSKKTSGAPASADKSQPDSGDDLHVTAQVAALLNNPDLHRVFPGIDYTPQNAQYPDCLADPPSQDNVTMDVAVLSQLTPLIRLYGTDCNQTDMVLAALDTLDLKDAVKIYLGVWLDGNSTTNDRQLAQFYDIVDTYGPDPFVGVVVGNEVLFREDMTETELIAVLDGVRSNLTAKGVGNFTVTSSDLGSAWTASLAAAVDVVMANIHPLFGGVPADQAAGWTWQYWQDHNVNLSSKPSVIAETGWPTAGGNRCTDSAGTKTACASATAGAVAGVDELNTFLADWVCAALRNGTEYFFFEALNEPWKARLNTPDEQWEDQWGLMTAERVLKDGVAIPDCGGAEAKVPGAA